MVRARTSGARAYIWEIICDDGMTKRQVDVSSVSYRSMEEAHAHGSVALDQFRRD
jgi:hypothetical protein